MSINVLKSGSLASLCLLIIASTDAMSVAHAGVKATFSDLKVGQPIEVKYKPSEAGDVIASKVEIGKPYKLQGQIEAIDDRNYGLTIVGMKVQANYEAKVTDSEGMPMDFSDLRVGQNVKIKGDVSPAGVFNAAKIKALRDEYSIEGVIEAINDVEMSITVLGVQGIATLASPVLDKDGASVEFSSLRRGQLVQVKGSTRSDGGFHVEEIELLEADGKLKLEGKIQSIDDAKGTVTVMGISIDVKKKNKIKFR